MPTVDITLRKGCSDDALEKSMKEISAAAEEILENTLVRMIRVSIYEADDDMILQGEKEVKGIFPTVVFTIGPGRSDEARRKFGKRITEILVKNLGCPPEEIRIYLLSSVGNHFAIGGKVKDFSKKVK